MLIFDDTIQDKAWTDESELMCWHFDHCSGCTVRGTNLLNAPYYCNGTSIPVAFELVKKPIQYSDLATKKLKRRSDKTKNEIMREMIQTCINNALKFRFVLMDSWFFQRRTSISSPARACISPPRSRTTGCWPSAKMTGRKNVLRV